MPSYIFAKQPTTLCSEYVQKTIDSLKYVTKQSKTIAHENKPLINMGDQVCDRLVSLGKSEEVKNILTAEKTNQIKQIVNDHVHNIKTQIDVFLQEEIDPEIQLMQQRIDDLFKENKGKIKEFSHQAETTIDEFLKNPTVQDSLKKIKDEGKKLETHFKKLFK